MSGPAAGFDLGLHIVNESGGLGMRAVLGSNLLGSAQRFQTSGTILFWSVNGSYTTEQQISWWALGPSWSFPHPTARAEVYALLGMTSATASGNGMLVNTGGSEPGDSNSLVVITGTLWCLHLPKSGLSAELGGELHLGGPGTFWDSPAIVADSSGGFVRRTREASMTGIALRFGLSYQRHARKR